MKEIDDQFLTIRQFSKIYPWPSESGLRAMVQRADQLGLGTAFPRMGRRVLVKPQTLFLLIENRNRKEGGNLYEVPKHTDEPNRKNRNSSKE